MKSQSVHAVEENSASMFGSMLPFGYPESFISFLGCAFWLRLHGTGLQFQAQGSILTSRAPRR